MDKIEQEKEQRKAFREWVRPDMKAEFINGEVISHSPDLRRHNQAVKLISSILDNYADIHYLGEVAIEKAMVGLERSDLEPDVVFWKKETADGFDDELLYYPAPDFVAEVLSDSTKNRDRGVKFKAYETAGVSEYWLIDAKAKTVEQYQLTEMNPDDFMFILKENLSHDDFVNCIVFPGLTIPIAAFFDKKQRGRVIRNMVMLREEE